MKGHDEESLGSGDSEPHSDDGERPRFAWHTRHTVFLVIAVLVLAAAIASSITIPYYAITPGTAQSVERMIGVPKSAGHSHKGQVLLVDVQLTPMRAIEWPWFALDSNAQIIGSSALLGPESPGQYQVEGELDMANAQQAATVVALRRLGYKVAVRPDGALIYAVLPGSPAERWLPVGDVVTSVDHQVVRTNADLGRLLSTYKPGATVTMGVLTYPKRTPKSVRVRLSAWRIEGTGKQATLACPQYGTGLRFPLYHRSPETGMKVGEAPCIGALNVETNYQVGKLPLHLDLSSEGIIGPSAGLAFTLGLINRLDPYDLTGGHKVAATGTMSILGQVGDVGGVAQKTVAVRSAGASVFFVPPQEYKVALAHAGSKLKVYAVSTVAQAIRILEQHYGGRMPRAKSG